MNDHDERSYLSKTWRQLGRVATFVGVLTSPAAFEIFHRSLTVGWSIVFTILTIGAFRGLVDIILKKLVPRPSLFGLDDKRLAEQDVLFRRRTWFWRQKFKILLLVGGLVVLVSLFQILFYKFSHLDHGVTPWGTAGVIFHTVKHLLHSRTLWLQIAIMPLFFLVNFGILMGPLMLMGIMQIRGFEPGDADWGVKLDDVRGQREAKEDVRKIVTLWQSGEYFSRAGGKKERGILFIGPPGTGKTMLAKAIATGFNSPIVTIPGSGFAQTFIGMDAVIVRFLARKAKKLARKWGGQCIVFIDEIDAVGMRRGSLAGGTVMGGGMMGMGTGQLALNQLLVVMDGIDSPPFLRRVLTNKVNSLLDAVYIIPRRIKNVPLRIPQAKPSTDQIYFIGATNVSLDALDPALVRPGRLGRHIYFRDPTLNDRKDVFDLYLNKVKHDETVSLDELARISDGYSPAQIEQACSMALTRAVHDGREAFNRDDILEAMTSVETGTALGWDYTPEEKRAIAVHEAGHAIAAHAFMKDKQHNRLSIKRRGDSGGHHSAADKEDRFVKWRDEVYGELIWGLGSLAAEYVIYGQNSQGVGGDLWSVTDTACNMVGRWGMGPDKEDEESTAISVELGTQLIQLSGMYEDSPSYAVLSDEKKFDLVAQLVGQAYTSAYSLMLHNRKAVEALSDKLVEKEEIYGDDLVFLLDSLEITIPAEEVWPVLR